MKRPTRAELEQDTWVPFGTVILNILDALGIDIDELPDIIPDDPPDSPEFEAFMRELFESKGWEL